MMDILSQLYAINENHISKPPPKKTKRFGRIKPGSCTDQLLRIMDDTVWTVYRAGLILKDTKHNTVRGAINRLVQFGYVEIVGRQLSGRGGRNPEFLFKRKS